MDRHDSMVLARGVGRILVRGGLRRRMSLLGPEGPLCTAKGRVAEGSGGGVPHGGGGVPLLSGVRGFVSEIFIGF